MVVLVLVALLETLHRPTLDLVVVAVTTLQVVLAVQELLLFVINFGELLWI